MKTLLGIIIFALSFSLNPIKAQQTTTTKDTINGNVVITTADSRIDRLYNATLEKCKTNKITENNNSTLNKEPLIKSNPTHETREVAKPLSTSDICRRTPKLRGYKILVSTVHNSQDANKIRIEVRENFPDLRTELDSSLRPNYKILAGSFFSKQSGQHDLKRVKRVYPQASLISYRIFCAEAK